jgi:hypothetical protein
MGPRSETKTKGDADCRLSSAAPATHRRGSDVLLPHRPWRGGRAWCRSRTRSTTTAGRRAPTRRPCRKPIRIIVASRCPHRLPLATLIRRSTSTSVSCSRSRPISRLLRRRSATVRNSESGVTSRRFDFAMIFAAAQSSTVRNFCQSLFVRARRHPAPASRASDERRRSFGIRVEGPEPMTKSGYEHR